MQQTASSVGGRVPGVLPCSSFCIRIVLPPVVSPVVCLEEGCECGRSPGGPLCWDSVKLKVDERITRQELNHRGTGKSWMTTSRARRMPQYTTGQETLLSRLLAYPRETKPQYTTGQETLLSRLLAYPRETKPQYTTGHETLLQRLLAYPRETKPQYTTGQETLLSRLLAYPRETKDIAPLRDTTKPPRQHFFFF